MLGYSFVKACVLLVEHHPRANELVVDGCMGTMRGRSRTKAGVALGSFVMPSDAGLASLDCPCCWLAFVQVGVMVRLVLLGPNNVTVCEW